MFLQMDGTSYPEAWTLLSSGIFFKEKKYKLSHIPKLALYGLTEPQLRFHLMENILLLEAKEQNFGIYLQDKK